MDHTILNAIGDTDQNDISGSELDSTSLTHLLDLRVICCVAKNEHYTGSRCVINRYKAAYGLVPYASRIIR